MEQSEGIADKIVTWLQDYALQAGVSGYVVGLSGGIDSACTAALCQRAMGEHVLGVLMPCHSPPDDAELAHLVAETFGLDTFTVDLGSTFDVLLAALAHGISDLALANLKPRLRMATLYALAQTRGYLVAGTGNRSEIAIGYFTKYGDGGVDVEPLGELYKWQVRQLAGHLGIPQSIRDRPPSAGLWAGQTDEEELGVSYDDLDATLAAIDAKQTGTIDPTLVARIQSLIAISNHKRSIPPTCPI
jgi:NAD+ synthase